GSTRSGWFRLWQYHAAQHSVVSRPGWLPRTAIQTSFWLFERVAGGAGVFLQRDGLLAFGLGQLAPTDVDHRRAHCPGDRRVVWSKHLRDWDRTRRRLLRFVDRADFFPVVRKDVPAANLGS